MRAPLQRLVCRRARADALASGCAFLGVRRALLIPSLLITLAGSASSTAAETIRRTFTVADSIAMTRIVDPRIPPKAFSSESSAFKWSPDGTQFTIVTATGNLATGLNEYALRLFNAEDVVAFVNSPGRTQLPDANVIARINTASNRHGIDAAKWLPDSKRIAFIGRGPDEIGQVYVYEIATKKLLKLTNHPADVARFDLSWRRGKLVYAAYHSPDWSARKRRGYVVEPGDALYLQRIVPERVCEYFVADLSTSTVARLPIAPVFSIYGPREIYMSPSGRWAVTALPVRRYPARWIDYAFVRAQYEAQLLSLEPLPGRAAVGEHPTEKYFTFDSHVGPDDTVNQLVLIDVEKGHAKPLLDAPTIIPGVAAVYYSGTEARWSPDGNRVLLPSTMLPLADVSAPERERRARAIAMAEVDVSTSTVTPLLDVVDEGEAAADAQPLSTLRVNLQVNAQWVRDDGVLATVRRSSTDEAVARRLVKDGGAWIEVQSFPAAHEGRDPPALHLSVEQAMDTPPDLLARDLGTGRERVISDLNPQFRQLALGRVEVFRWRDRHDRQLSGGLVLPSDYEKGRRYPVVIQMGRFKPDEFLVDGLGSFGTTAFAARAFAGRGMLVLEPTTLKPQPLIAGETEGEMIVSLVEDVVDALDAASLIDRRKVGLLGFSRTGMFAQTIVTFSKYAFAAATVADSVAMTPFCYARAYGLPDPSMSEFEREWTMGAAFWGPGTAMWQERSDLFHLDRIRTPIRYETNGPEIPCHWEAFTILSRMQRPVEMIHFPLGDHLLIAPAMRYTSVQGNVDWFSFWLRGEEDPDPSKMEQYSRWRKLRMQRDAVLAEKVVADDRGTSANTKKTPDLPARSLPRFMPRQLDMPGAYKPSPRSPRIRSRS